MDICESIRERAKDLGFIATGFIRPHRPAFFNDFLLWISSGKNGGMSWLERNIHLREDPKGLLDECRTIITLAYPYSSKKPCTPDGFTASRYTEPDKRDYHTRLRKTGKALISFLKSLCPGERWRVCVDSAPIMERSFAYASGIGFIGRNNMLIVPGYGSYLFLVEILTTAYLDIPKPIPMESMCGSCTRCIEACPSGALESPYTINARRCLSYLTIEHEGPLPPGIAKKMGNCFLGCDVCQEVCPFNREALAIRTILPSTKEIMDMDEREFKSRFGKTAFGYAGLAKIKRNIEAITRD